MHSEIYEILFHCLLILLKVFYIFIYIYILALPSVCIFHHTPQLYFKILFPLINPLLSSVPTENRFTKFWPWNKKGSCEKIPVSAASMSL